MDLDYVPDEAKPLDIGGKPLAISRSASAAQRRSGFERPTIARPSWSLEATAE